jgi:serine phosphatase RsbU (regulator of sigma subunit)
MVAKKTHFVGIHQDITKQKEADLKLKNYALMLEKKSNELEKAYDAIEKNIKKAKRLHRHFFPIELPEIEGIELEAFYEPAHNIGSDYYNFVHLKDQLIIYVVDVSGNGIDGAFINIFIRQKINRYLSVEIKDDDNVSPKELLNFLAKHFVKEQFPEEYFICLYVAVLDLTSKCLTYSNAGIQVPPMIVNNGKLTSLNLGGLPISSVIDIELLSYEEETTYLDEASTFVISTDGIVESIVDDDIYGIERFQQLVLEHYYLPPKELKNVINTDLNNVFKKQKSHDDITYVILKTSSKVIKEKQFIMKSDCQAVEYIVGQMTSWLETYTNSVNCLLVGFNEMVYNAIEHGNKFELSKKVSINIEVNSVYILITIEDEGEGFNWRSCMNKVLDIMNFEERGRGIIYTKASFDYFTYNEKGNKVYLYKKNTTI